MGEAQYTHLYLHLFKYSCITNFMLRDFNEVIKTLMNRVNIEIFILALLS
jgi:hypothetical protein